MDCFVPTFFVVFGYVAMISGVVLCAIGAIDGLGTSYGNRRHGIIYLVLGLLMICVLAAVATCHERSVDRSSMQQKLDAAHAERDQWKQCHMFPNTQECPE